MQGYECWTWRRQSTKELMFWNLVLEKTLESPLESKEIKSVSLKGNQPWMFIRKADDEAKDPILWPPHVRSWLFWKALDAGKDWGHEEKGTTEDQMIGRHHQLNGQEFEQTLGDGEGQGSKVCCSSWGHKESDMTEQLKYNDITYVCHTKRLNLSNFTPVLSWIWEFQIYTD